MYLCKNKWKYLFLLFIPPLIIFPLFYDNGNYIYILPASLSLSVFIIFSIFPAIVLSLHARPITYDDLIIKDYNEDECNNIYDNKFRRKYQNIFRWLVTITSTMVFFVSVEVWGLKSNFSVSNSNSDTESTFISADWAFAIGVIGGILKIYYSISSLIGKILLSILKMLKKRAIKKARQNMSQITHNALYNAGIDIKEVFNTPLSSRRSFSHNDLTIIGVSPDVDMHDIMSQIDT